MDRLGCAERALAPTQHVVLPAVQTCSAESLTDLFVS